MNEAKFKDKFKKSVRNHGGAAISLAAPMISGIPDLWVALPEFMPVLLEVKYLGEISRDKFSRKVPFTEIQQHWIQQCDNVLPYSAMGLVGFYYNSLYYAVLVKYGTPCFYKMTSDFKTQCSYVSIPNLNIHFDITTLFHNVPIPRVEKITKKEHSIYDDLVSLEGNLKNFA